MARTLVVDMNLLTFLVGSLIPFLVALLTKASAPSGVKALANVVLSILGGVGTYLMQHNGSADVWHILAAAAAVFISSVTTYHSLWKPLRATQAVAKSTATVGVG